MSDAVHCCCAQRCLAANLDPAADHDYCHAGDCVENPNRTPTTSDIKLPPPPRLCHWCRLEILPDAWPAMLIPQGARFPDSPYFFCRHECLVEWALAKLEQESKRERRPNGEE